MVIVAGDFLRVMIGWKMRSLVQTLLLFLLASGASCDGRSLAFVFDTTGSMSSELRQVKAGGRRILQAALENPQRDWRDFILVPFNDPEVGPATTTTDPDEFSAELERIRVTGGGDCPENSIGGVLQALEASRPYSYIYVFTDATAKDYNLTDRVVNLIQTKNSKIVFIMTGDCSSRSSAGFTAYETIASASSGQVFRVARGNVEEVLDAVIETTIEGPDAVSPGGGSDVYGESNILSRDQSSATEAGGETVAFNVDNSIEDLTVSLSGPTPRITVYDGYGRIPSSSQLRETLRLPTVIMMKIDHPLAGNWTLNYSSSSAHSLRVRGNSFVDFQQSFAVRNAPAYVNRPLARPLAGVPMYAVIKGNGLDSRARLESVEFIRQNGTHLFSKALESVDLNQQLYVTNSSFTTPTGFFFLRVTGTDEWGDLFQRISHSAVSAVPTGGLEECQRCSSDGSSRCVMIGGPTLSSARFMCQCIAPYFTGDGTVCNDVNECILNTDNCHANATCTNTRGGYTCSCDDGWTGDGLHCERANTTDECSLELDNCDTNARCLDTPTSFKCLCNDGYEGNGANCTDINECSADLPPCEPNEVCENVAGGVSCSCREGFEREGESCVDIDECALNIYKCDSIKETCENNAGGYDCVCIDGYESDGTQCVASCGGNVTGEGGSFHSPNYPLLYYHHAACVWNIDVYAGSIDLNITDLNIEYHESCDYDSLEVYNGETGALVERMCGSEGRHISIPATSVRVVFTSDHNVADQGWSLRWNRVPGPDETTTPMTTTLPTTTTERVFGSCGGTYYRETGAIASVNYPNNYRSNLYCTWRITVPAGQRIEITVPEFNVESASDCRYDYLNFYNGHSGSLIGSKHCGNSSFNVSGALNQMKVIFRTDGSVTRSGWLLRWRGVPIPTTTETTTPTTTTRPRTSLTTPTSTESTTTAVDVTGECGGTYNQETGVIASLNYPRYYTNNLHCTWYITVPADQRIEISVPEFNIESASDCRYDYLNFYDDYTNFQIGRKHCGSGSFSVSGTSNTIKVIFRTDSSSVYTGWYLRWRGVPIPTTTETTTPTTTTRPTTSLATPTSTESATTAADVTGECGGIYNQETGTIASLNYPSYYTNNLHCTWYITIPAGQRIEISVPEFHIESHSTCGFDSLTFYDGYTNTQIGHKHCGSGLFHVSGMSNKIKVIFRTDGSSTYTGWFLRWRGISAHSVPAETTPVIPSVPGSSIGISNSTIDTFNSTFTDEELSALGANSTESIRLD